MLGNVDVVVCDGFTGNVILKSLEGCGKAIINILVLPFFLIIRIIFGLVLCCNKLQGFLLVLKI